MVVCMSGSLSQTRAQLTKLWTSHGATVKGSVTKTTTHLITTAAEVRGKSTWGSIAVWRVVVYDGDGRG